MGLQLPNTQNKFVWPVLHLPKRAFANEVCFQAASLWNDVYYSVHVTNYKRHQGSNQLEFRGGGDYNL